MTLKHLSLTQFRSWAALKLGFDTRPVVLTGNNGSGKTNLLEALSMLAPGRGIRAAAAAEQGNLAAGIGWRIRAEIGDCRIETGAPAGASRTVLLDGKPVPQTRLGNLLRVIWLTPAMDRLFVDAPEVRRRFLDRLTLSFTPDHAIVAQQYERAMRERNRLLRDQVQDAAWYRALEAKMGEFGAILTANRLDAIGRLAEAQAEAGGDFPIAQLGLLPGEGYADELEAGAISERLQAGRRRDLAAGRSLTGPHRADLGASWGDNDLPAALSSTGEQKALLLSIILANARALAGQPVLLLLDEVSAHLDADRRAQLYDVVLAMQASIVLTGTGPELFETIASQARMLEVGKIAGVSGLEAV